MVASGDDSSQEHNGRIRQRGSQGESQSHKSSHKRREQREKEGKRDGRVKESEKAREKERDRDRDRDRDRKRDRDRGRDRDKERERERPKDKDREKEKEKERARNREKDRIKERDEIRRGSKRGRGSPSPPRYRHERDSKRVKEDYLSREEREKKRREEDEERKLEEQLEERRKRAQLWQEMRKKQEMDEKNRKNNDNKDKENGDQTYNLPKEWNLEDEQEDEYEQMEYDEEHGKEFRQLMKKQQQEDSKMEVDPLDAFMDEFVQPPTKIQKQVTQNKQVLDKGAKIENGITLDAKKAPLEIVQPPQARKPVGEMLAADQEDELKYLLESDVESEAESDGVAELLKTIYGEKKASKGERLAAVDHSKIFYPNFKRDFYIEVPQIQKMTEDEVNDVRKKLEIKVRGIDYPKPITEWTQSGLMSGVLAVLKKAGHAGPLPIQAQAIPVIMSGRDCIGIAKTGSGKTLAFILPLMRHIYQQVVIENRVIVSGDGPIGMIIAPTRELVQQIGKEVKRFTKVLNWSSVMVFGGGGVNNQINELKRGAEVVVCTPGRMIDTLTLNNGKVTNLRRVTYLVLDEADRMFDMGFEPQVSRLVSNSRPDRQTVMFSATFPRSVELLARRILKDPVEIMVGGRSVVNSDITQFVEVRPEDERLLRLLEILGEWAVKGKVLIFVNSQERADSLYQKLMESHYACLSLHGGKDQSDRESTIADFKGDVCNILVATSVAARGLDVSQLVLVVNYDVPNHHEDYVHRVGRTGRAGNKGTAITFISQEEERYSPDIVKALKESGVQVPQDISNLATGFLEKRKKGLVTSHGSGFGGSGYRFDSAEDEMKRLERKAKAREYGIIEDSDDDDNVGAIVGLNQPSLQQQQQLTFQALEQQAQEELNNEDGGIDPEVAQLDPQAISKKREMQTFANTILAKAATAQMNKKSSNPTNSIQINPLIHAFRAAANQLAVSSGLNDFANANVLPDVQPSEGNGALASNGENHFEAEVEINDFPQHTRWKVTHRDTLNYINDLTGAAVTTRGRFLELGKPLAFGERKLFLLIEGSTEISVKWAKAEIMNVLQETTEKALRRETQQPTQMGKYSVL